jgi:DNA-binding FrmR family transcriptional regulator
VTSGTSTDRHQSQYRTGPHTHQKKPANTLQAFSVSKRSQRILSSIPAISKTNDSCCNHIRNASILERGAGIEPSTVYKATIYINTPRGYYGGMKTEIKKKVIRRMQIVQGQMKGLTQMIEDEKYCVDIITQSSAIKEALSGIENLMLENHLTTHVLHQMKTGHEKKAVEEILKIYKLTQKKK